MRREQAERIHREDLAYLTALREGGSDVALPGGPAQRAPAADPRRERGRSHDASLSFAARNSGVPYSAAAVMTASVSPLVTAAPAEMGSSLTVPALWAVISFSIFMASITQMRAPSSTLAPGSTATLSTVP